MIEHHDQKQIKEGSVFWLMVPKGKSNRVRDNVAEEREAERSHLSGTQERNQKWDKAINSQSPSLVMYFLQEGSTS